ncbi:MAG: DUF58 domain-containing protein [Defluviitaleaceae bacterium]|nr:DUF58 domain-containing protein [Defluviitaleaceae bacterium]
MFILILGAIVLGLVLLQAYVYRKFWAHALTLDFRFSARDAFEGDTLYFHTEITNKKILPLPWLMLKYSLSNALIFPEGSQVEMGESVKTGLFSVMAYRRVRRKVEFTCSKRGFYRLRHVQITAANLLHSNTFRKELACYGELTVFPRLLEHIDEIEIATNTIDTMLLSHSLINPDPFTFRGLREYIPTDPLRNVNFKATAVAGQLMVNIHQPTSAKRLEIILNLEQYAPTTEPELYEQAIRLAATLAQHYISQDVMLGFYTNGCDSFTAESVRLPSGASAAQLYAVYHALGRLGLAFRPNSITRYLDELTDAGSIYVLISTCQNEEIAASLVALKARNLRVHTIMPISQGMTIPAATPIEATLWEALPC